MVGEGPPDGGTARSRSGAKTGRPAGRPEKAMQGPRNRSCKKSVQRAKKLGGAGGLARYAANRAENSGNGARSETSTAKDAARLTTRAMLKAGILQFNR